MASATECDAFAALAATATFATLATRSADGTPHAALISVLPHAALAAARASVQGSAAQRAAEAHVVLSTPPTPGPAAQCIADVSSNDAPATLSAVLPSGAWGSANAQITVLGEDEPLRAALLSPSASPVVKQSATNPQPISHQNSILLLVTLTNATVHPAGSTVPHAAQSTKDPKVLAAILKGNVNNIGKIAVNNNNDNSQQ